jgi:hypothetical protein
MSSRRERIMLSVLSASDCAFKAAVLVDVLRALGKTDLDSTDVARDHSFPDGELRTFGLPQVIVAMWG